MESFTGDSGAAWSYDPASRIGDPSGMGQVFRGSDAGGRPIAVKRVTLRIDTEGERRRREREREITQALADLPADHLLPTLDVGRVGEDLLFVMPLATRSLAAALAAGDMENGAHLDALRQIAQGLVELASASVLHRDLKPENVLFHDGRWQLADFGIARNVLESTGTYTFLGWGTQPYMAPELWDGKAATVKSDLYALGVIAYELLAGRRPFPGPGEAELRRQHQLDQPPDPAGVPPALGRLMLRLLAKNPAERPQDARTVVEALDAALRHLTPQQDLLRQAALEAEQRRAATEARSAVAAAREVGARDECAQALADLYHLLEDAAELARAALPEATFLGDGAQWHLRWGEARLTVSPWPGVARADVPGGDPLVVAGVVWVVQTGGSPGANVVCERQGDRLVWSLLRFSASAIVGPNYGFGPLDRPHGFDQQTFARERVYMVHTAAHVWTMQKTALTAEAVVALFQEAIASV